MIDAMEKMDREMVSYRVKWSKRIMRMMFFSFMASVAVIILNIYIIISGNSISILNSMCLGMMIYNALWIAMEYVNQSRELKWDLLAEERYNHLQEIASFEITERLKKHEMVQKNN